MTFSNLHEDPLSTPDTCLEGLDIARFLAFVGMVIVNFNMVMTGGVSSAPGIHIGELLQGRAAAAFVVLAGIGLGLASQRKAWNFTVETTLKRALFLLVLGLLNMLVFDADIIHYYALYFLFALLFLRVSNAALWAAMIGLSALFTVMIFVFNFDTGWNWETYTYSGFWTPAGFFRNLFFNGWHPVIPWMAFVIFGIWLSRLDLKTARVRRGLMIYGAVVYMVTTGLSAWLMNITGKVDAEAAILFSTSPVPPFPLYMLAGASFASMLIGLCLYLEAPLRRMGVLSVFTVPGRQTLTLYMAHIFLGMGTLEALGLLGGQTAGNAFFASMLFCVIAVVYSLIWSKLFKRGPLEMLMRRMTS